MVDLSFKLFVTSTVDTSQYSYTKVSYTNCGFHVGTALYLTYFSYATFYSFWYAGNF